MLSLAVPLALSLFTFVDRRTGWVSSHESLSGLVLVPELSEEELVPSSGPLETWLDFAASFKALRLFFFGLERAGDGDRDCDGEEMRVFSFCFLFLVDGGSDVELRDDDAGCDTDFKEVAGDNDGGGPDDTSDAFLLFFVCVDFFCDKPVAS